MVRSMSWTQVLDLIVQNGPRGKKVFGIPRGGSIIAGLLEIAKGCKAVESPQDADVLIDDIVDSGETKKLALAEFPGRDFWALIPNKTPGTWIRFPWESEQIETDLGTNVTRIIEALGEDPNRDGLKDTPARVMKSLMEMTRGAQEDPEAILSRQFKVEYDEMIVVRSIPFWSLCEHHMMPFYGEATIGYLPEPRAGKVVGLSKIPRLVNCFSKRLQIQERMTTQIAEAMDDALKPMGVGVIVKARHTCMTMRGVRAPGELVTSKLIGAFKKNPTVRSEFLQLAKGFV